ncbi:Nucleolar pre-ribosomal-associated protein 1 C-terminal domain-containing protein [Entamoeba marina]
MKSILFVHRTECAIPFKNTLPLETLTKEMVIINNRSNDIDNPVVSLGYSTCSALAVLLRRVQPTPEVFSFIQSDFVHEFFIPQSTVEVWHETAPFLSPIMKLINNDALKHKETAVITRTALCLTLAGKLFGKPLRQPKAIFGVDNEEDYIPNDFGEVYESLVIGVEESTNRYTKMNPKPRFINNFALLLHKNDVNLNNFQTPEDIKLISEFIHDLHCLLNKKLQITNHFLSLLHPLEIVIKLSNILSKYTSSYIDNYLKSNNVDPCAHVVFKTGITGINAIDQITQIISSRSEYSTITEWFVFLKHIVYCFNTCIDMLLVGTERQEIGSKIRNNIIKPLYTSINFLDIIRTNVNELTTRSQLLDPLHNESITVDDKNTTNILDIDTNTTKPKEVNLQTNIDLDNMKLPDLIETLSTLNDIPNTLFDDIFKQYIQLPVCLIEPISYCCLNENNRKCIENIIQKEIGTTYDNIFDNLSQYLISSQPSHTFISVQKSLDFWEVQDIFNDYLPSQRDTSRTHTMNGQLMLYITRTFDNDVLSYLHESFLQRFIHTLPTTHSLYTSPYDKLLYNDLWGTHTPPVSSPRQASEALISLQTIIPIEQSCMDSFIHNLLESSNIDLILSCILQQKKYITAGLECALTKHLPYSEHYLKCSSSHSISEGNISLIIAQFKQNPIQMLHIIASCLPYFSNEMLYNIYKKLVSLNLPSSNLLISQYIQSTISVLLFENSQFQHIQPPTTIISIIAYHHSMKHIQHALLEPEHNKTMIITIVKLLQNIYGSAKVIDLLRMFRNSWVEKNGMAFLWDLVCISSINNSLDRLIIEDIFQFRPDYIEQRNIITRRDTILSLFLQHL